MGRVYFLVGDKTTIEGCENEAMTVKELIEYLKEFHDESDKVLIDVDGGYSFSAVTMGNILSDYEEGVDL